MKITYLGHSCFRVESQGWTIVLDPYGVDSVPGYRPVQEEADQVLCSHGRGGVGHLARRPAGRAPGA